MPDFSIKNVKEFFGMTLTEFKAEWAVLPEADRDQIKRGIADGSLTY